MLSSLDPPLPVSVGPVSVMAPADPTVRLVPLSDTQMAEFAANGLLVLPLSLPPAFLERFYDTSGALVKAEADRAAVWRQMDPDVNAIAADPVRAPLSNKPLFSGQSSSVHLTPGLFGRGRYCRGL